MRQPWLRGKTELPYASGRGSKVGVDAMKLDDDQQQQVARWIQEGARLADIQARIGEDFGISLTYMEVRFLVDDIGAQIRDPEPEPKSDDGTNAADGGGKDAPAGWDDESSGSQQGRVSVTVDQITRPGALVSGKAVFGDGAKSDWILDQFGRLSLIPETQGYKPSESDMAEFQAELQTAIQKAGY